jgi:hypothetical protein
MPSIKTLTMALAATTATASPLALANLRRQESATSGSIDFSAIATSLNIDPSTLSSLSTYAEPYLSLIPADFNLRDTCNSIPSEVSTFFGGADTKQGELGTKVVDIIVSFTGASAEDVKADIVDAGERLEDACLQLAELLEGFKGEEGKGDGKGDEVDDWYKKPEYTTTTTTTTTTYSEGWTYATATYY